MEFPDWFKLKWKYYVLHSYRLRIIGKLWMSGTVNSDVSES